MKTTLIIPKDVYNKMRELKKREDLTEDQKRVILNNLLSKCSETTDLD